VFGALAAFVGETGWQPPAGQALSFAVTSRVPTAQGVSSSASVEVATLRALTALTGKSINGLRLAHLAQVCSACHSSLISTLCAATTTDSRHQRTLTPCGCCRLQKTT
jgi:galactokinase